MPERIDVVIVAYDSSAYLPRLAESLRGVDAVASVTVADNRSSDASAQVARECDWGAPVQVIEMPTNAGFGSAINAAARSIATPSPQLLVVNPDVVVPSGVLERLQAIFESDPATAVAGVQLVTSAGAPVSSARDFPNARSIRRRTFKDVDHGGRIVEADWLCGAFMLWRRRSFDDVGGFGKGYFLYYEDVDICAKVRQAGGNVKIDGSLTAIHDQGHGKPTAAPLRRSNRQSRRRYARAWLGFPGVVAAVIADLGDWAAGRYHVIRGDR